MQGQMANRVEYDGATILNNSYSIIPSVIQFLLARGFFVSLYYN